MNVDFGAVLKSFNMGQRLLVLIIILLVGSGTYIAVAYLKTDDCSPLVKENADLIKTIVETSELLHKRSYMDVAETRSMNATQDTIYVDQQEVQEMLQTDIAAAKLDSIISIYKK